MECILGAAKAANALEFALRICHRPKSPEASLRSRSITPACTELDGTRALVGANWAPITREFRGGITGITGYPTSEDTELRTDSASLANDVFRVRNSSPKRGKSSYGFTSGGALARGTGQDQLPRKGQGCVEGNARSRSGPFTRSRRRHIHQKDRGGIAFGAAFETCVKSSSSDDQGCADLPTANPAEARACVFRKSKRIRTQDSVAPNACRTLPRAWRSYAANNWNRSTGSAKRIPSQFLSPRTRIQGTTHSAPEAMETTIQNSAKYRLASASGTVKQAVNQRGRLIERRSANICGSSSRCIYDASLQPVRHTASQDKSGGRAVMHCVRKFPPRKATAMPRQRSGRTGPRASEWPQARKSSDFSALRLQGGSQSVSRRAAGKVGCSTTAVEIWNIGLAGRMSSNQRGNFDEPPSLSNRIPSQPSFGKKQQKSVPRCKQLRIAAVFARSNGAARMESREFN